MGPLLRDAKRRKSCVRFPHLLTPKAHTKRTLHKCTKEKSMCGTHYPSTHRAVHNLALLDLRAAPEKDAEISTATRIMGALWKSNPHARLKSLGPLTVVVSWRWQPRSLASAWAFRAQGALGQVEGRWSLCDRHHSSCQARCGNSRWMVSVLARVSPSVLGHSCIIRFAIHWLPSLIATQKCVCTCMYVCAHGRERLGHCARSRASARAIVRVCKTL